MSDIEAKAVRKIGRGFMSVLKGVGEGIAAISESIQQRNDEQAQIQEAVDAFNDKWHRYSSDERLVLVPQSRVQPKTTIRTCGASTGFWDCEDPDCFFHKAEKNRRGIGTPTRNYRES